MAKNEDKEEGARSFGVFLAELNSGAAHSELTEELQKVLSNLSAVADLRGTKGTAKGSLTLKLALEVAANGTARVKFDVSSKYPKPDRDDDSFWLTRNSNLTRKNPKQQELPHIRDVSAPENRGDVGDTAATSRL